ncbi:PKD domain-containing protein [Streptomyces sp. NPDC002209]|uniref:PKD domain-containing protein n=1 Tax=Streptomyces sp. NPDC002209 TaxID=3364638 RepID=UPI0036A44FC6
MSAALMAAGLGLIPGMASAADGPSAPAAPVRAEPGKTALKTYHSPADRTVRTALPAGGNKAAAAQAQSAAGNPQLALDISGSDHTALGLEIKSTITSEDVPLDVTIDWGDGKTDKVTTKGSGDRWDNHTYTEVGEYQVKVTVTDAANGVRAVNGFSHLTQGTEFNPYAPTRLLDTRNGTGTKAGKVAGRGTTRVKVTGIGGIPAGGSGVPTGVEAVALNVTVTNTAEPGHITVWRGDDTGIPDTSNLNYAAGQSVSNLVIVPVGADGYVDLFNGGWGPVDLVVDITGYFTHTPASGYTTMAPTRFVDTRDGLGTPKGQLAGRKSFGAQIGGVKGVPQGVTAVALNVTATNPKDAGHLSLYPGGGTVPTASSLNFATGETVANSVIVPVGPDGSVNVFNGSWSPADVVVDVVGYYSKDGKAAYSPTGNYRYLDTRVPGDWYPGGKFPARGYIAKGFAVIDDPAGDEAYVMNTTVTNTTDAGFLSVAPSPFPWLVNDQPGAPVPPRPVSSNLNWTAGKTVANLAQASDGEHGVIHFWNQGWKDADLIVDVYGVYQTR